MKKAYGFPIHSCEDWLPGVCYDIAEVLERFLQVGINDRQFPQFGDVRSTYFTIIKQTLATADRRYMWMFIDHQPEKDFPAPVTTIAPTSGLLSKLLRARINWSRRADDNAFADSGLLSVINPTFSIVEESTRDIVGAQDFVADQVDARRKTFQKRPMGTRIPIKEPVTSPRGEEAERHGLLSVGDEASTCRQHTTRPPSWSCRSGPRHSSALQPFT